MDVHVVDANDNLAFEGDLVDRGVMSSEGIARMALPKATMKEESMRQYQYDYQHSTFQQVQIMITS